jgi:hypothetical protein
MPTSFGDTTLASRAQYSTTCTERAPAHRVVPPFHPYTRTRRVVKVSQHVDQINRRIYLEWVFAKADETLRCRLALDAAALTYEIQTRRAGAGASATTEHFLHVGRALDRQADLEGQLIADGWTLQAYASGVLGAPDSTRPPSRA